MGRDPDGPNVTKEEDLMANLRTRILNYYIDGHNPPVRVARRQAIGIFDRQDRLIRIGTFEDYQAYWRDDLTMEEYEARKLLPEVPYSFWIYEPIGDTNGSA